VPSADEPEARGAPRSDDSTWRVDSDQFGEASYCFALVLQFHTGETYNIQTYLSLAALAGAVGFVDATATTGANAEVAETTLTRLYIPPT
jgi:hypothetical protein